MSASDLLLPAVRPVARPVVRARRLPWRRRPPTDDAPRPPLLRRVVRRVVKVLLWALLVLVLALIWVGARGAMAVNALLDAGPAIEDVTAALSVETTPSVIASAGELATAIHHAHGLVQDPVWTAVQHVPVLGERLISVRSALAAADILATDGLGPVVALSQNVSFGPYPKAGSGFARLVQASELNHDLTGIGDAILRARAELDGVSTDLVLPMLSDPFDEAVSTLDEAGDVAAALVPGVRGMLEISGYRAPASTVVAVLDPGTSRPLGGSVERVFLVTVNDGKITDLDALDPGTVLAAAGSSAPFTTAAAGPQAALLADRSADVTQLASMPDAAAALGSGVTAMTGTPVGAVVLLTPAGIDTLTQGLAAGAADAADAAAAAPVVSLVDTLSDAAPEARAGLIDPAADAAVRSVLGLTARADRLALTLRDAVVGGGLRVWFADATTQAPLAEMRGTGALPATTGQGIPVSVTLDTGGAPSVLRATGLTVSAGTCGRLWTSHPALGIDVVLEPTDPAAEAAALAAAGVGLPRVLIGVPTDATVTGVSDGRGKTLAHSELELAGQRLLIVPTTATTTRVHVAVAGRAGQTAGLTAVSRGTVPTATPGPFTCS